MSTPTAALLSLSPESPSTDPRRSSSSSSTTSSISNLSTLSHRSSTSTLSLRPPLPLPAPPLLAHLLATWGVGVSLLAILLAPFAPLLSVIPFLNSTDDRDRDREQRAVLLRRRRREELDKLAVAAATSKKKPTTASSTAAAAKRPFSLDAAILSTSGHSLALGTGDQPTRALIATSPTSSRSVSTASSSSSHQHLFTPRPHHPRISSISHLPTHIESAHSSEDEPVAFDEDDEDDDDDGESDSDASEVHTISEHGGDGLHQQHHPQPQTTSTSKAGRRHHILSTACSCPRKKRKARLQAELSSAGLSLSIPPTSPTPASMITRSAPVTSPQRLSWPNSIASSPAASLGPATPGDEREIAEEGMGGEGGKRKLGFLRRLSSVKKERGERKKRRSMNASVESEGEVVGDGGEAEKDMAQEKEARDKAKERRRLSWHVS